MKKRERRKDCPACGHAVEIGKKSKIILKNKEFLKVECDVCEHKFIVNKEELK